MPTSRRRLATVLAVGSALALPGTALGVALKVKVRAGYYADGSTGVTIITNNAATSLKSVSIACHNGQVTLSRAIKITSRHTFAYTGTVKFGTTTTTGVLSGAFTGNGVRGRFHESGTTAGCSTIFFNARYYGLHPKG